MALWSFNNLHISFSFEFSPLGPKDPLRVKVQEEIKRVGVMGRPIGLTSHFPFLDVFSTIFIFYLILFLFFLYFVSFTFAFALL
jgi:hypothetical protein